MKRLGGLVLVVGLLIAGTTTAHAEEATPKQWQEFASDLADLEDTVGIIEASLAVSAPIQEWRWDQCRFQGVDKPTWTPREERLTAQCVTDRWSVDGGIAKFVAVGDCESSWYRFANNGGRYLGIFQHAASSWLGRVRWAMPDDWKVGPWQRWTNSRSQVITTARLVHANGWGMWSCA